MKPLIPHYMLRLYHLIDESRPVRLVRLFQSIRRDRRARIGRKGVWARRAKNLAERLS
jgi:hypothetical protein